MEEDVEWVVEYELGFPLFAVEGLVPKYLDRGEVAKGRDALNG